MIDRQRVIDRQGLLDDAIRRVIASNGLLDQIRAEFARLVDEFDPTEHKHVWFKTCSWPDPPVDIFDCNCGARGFLRKHFGASPEVEVITLRGNSAENALNVIPELRSSRSAMEIQSSPDLLLSSPAV